MLKPDFSFGLSSAGFGFFSFANFEYAAGAFFCDGCRVAIKYPCMSRNNPEVTPIGGNATTIEILSFTASIVPRYSLCSFFLVQDGVFCSVGSLFVRGSFIKWYAMQTTQYFDAISPDTNTGSRSLAQTNTTQTLVIAKKNQESVANKNQETTAIEFQKHHIYIHPTTGSHRLSYV